ncbi:uncharacterized protein THITE_113414 [Thermothielavioides terrestris NRRL 8126]|jgi:hypothetical protein|uniref:SET domain-containing protein n=1 Tax=Thermothielavioides terrestris (strain ATCC 38088 / NRRL 8126) TaxID=578455 RepID=G2R9C6_THETT|nr:uncharacterized protein THITE_113414 [Thermothielavioides terrestris NRRL 8126]AEO68667.1 hypothetical protein THITE_113414 [Thermothielavioides terrestris NRRL 8126]
MAGSQLSWARVLLLGLVAPLVAVGVDAKRAVNADPPPAGSADGLASEPIEKRQVYTGNETIPAPQSPPVQGWWESKICSGIYCVYTNHRVANGRGLVAVTRFEEFQKLGRIENHLDRAENRYFDDPVPFTTTDVVEKGPGVTATKPLRRGKQLMSWSPVLVVHKSFFDEVPKKKDRTRLLETAVSYLPPATRAAFDKQRLRPGDTANANPRSIEEILHAHPFEIDLGFGNRVLAGPQDPAEPAAHSRHFANYPEVSALQHDCRPNVATYIDGPSFALRATVARRTQPGEELTIAYIDPFLPRKERAAWVRRHRGLAGSGGGSGSAAGCPCRACNPPGGPEGEAAKEADRRMEELLAIRAELRNHDSTKVDFPMIERFLKLYEEERLHARFAEAYELAAVNFNYLGDDKRAKKYADLAVQAGIVEGGPDSNDVAAMRIMASDVTGHYSHRYSLKRRGQ